jgi:pimeloyl-[acyl-carrier protein] methyl ester esterase
MPFLSHGGVSLRYERAGAGLPAVFIHGLMCNHTFWDRQAPLRRDLQMVRLDLRGHGDSSKPRGAYGMASLATEVERLAAALQLPRCVLVGWSMGGLVALEAARLLGDRLAGLVLVATTASPAARADHPHGMSREEAEQQLALAESDYKGFARTLAGRLFRASPEGLVQWATQQLLRTPPYVGLAALHGLLAADGRALLPSIRVPTLVLHGQHDTIFPLPAAEHLATHVRGARLVVFGDSAHAPMIEETERFNAELGAFAASVAGAGAAPTSADAPEPPAPGRRRSPTGNRGTAAAPSRARPRGAASRRTKPSP